MNAKDEDGVTSLQYAAEGGYNEIVELLIDKGANVKGDDGNTPLDYAESKTADLLRKHGGKAGSEKHYIKHLSVSGLIPNRTAATALKVRGI